MNFFKTEPVKLIKKDGTEQTINCHMQPKFASYKNPKISIDEGDILEKKSSSGIERFVITEANRYGAISALGEHYQLHLEKEELYRKKCENNQFKNISIQGVEYSQISLGSNNVLQKNELSIVELITKIKECGAPEQDKDEALKLLDAFLKHPIVAAVAGSSIFPLINLIQ